MILKIPAYLTGFGSRVDKSAGLRFTTQELNGETFAQLQELNQTFGWLIFSPNDISPEDIPSENAEEEGISSSERLRRILFVLFKQKEIKEDFETWRRKYMEKIIQAIKDKLD